MFVVSVEAGSTAGSRIPVLCDMGGTRVQGIAYYSHVPCNKCRSESRRK